MAIKDTLLPEFEQEMAITRRVLERVREDKYEWAPHEKSTQAGRLASHIAEMVAWGVATLNQDTLNLAGHQPFNAASQSELLEVFDRNVEEFRKALEGTDDDKFMQSWSLMKERAVLMIMPKIAVIRTLILNHIIHHRGQLSVYLRLTGTPVPAIYGPSADEGPA